MRNPIPALRERLATAYVPLTYGQIEVGLSVGLTTLSGFMGTLMMQGAMDNLGQHNYITAAIEATVAVPCIWGVALGGLGTGKGIMEWNRPLPGMPLIDES